MEKILEKLILPDSSAINEGTNELKEAFKNSDAIPGLCSSLGSSPNPQIRQMAAVIMRRKLNNHRFWVKLPQETRQFVKQGLMQALINEQEKTVKSAVAQVIGVLVHHELPEQSWPEIMMFITQMTTSQNINDKELGFFTLNILTYMAPAQFLDHAHSFANLFASVLNSLENPASKLAYLTVMCMTNFVSAVEGDQVMVNAYHSMIPSVVVIVKALAKKRPDEAIEALSLIDELAEDAVNALVPHVKLIVETCSELAIDKSCGFDLQIKVLNIIGTLVETKKKLIVKLKLVEPILDTLFRLMCEPSEDENADDFPDLDDSTPATVANQTLDVMALHLPPEKLLPPLMEKYIVPSTQQSEPHVRKAAYLAMAVVAEGCADYIRHRLVSTFLSYVMIGLRDHNHTVMNAALFAVGQFSEFLQPNISTHASELLPFLILHLESIAEKKDEPAYKVDRIFYAMESFCEHLNDGLLPFLPKLMELLIPLLSPPYPTHLRELAISAVGSCGEAAKDSIMPYFVQIMERLKLYLTEIQSTETMCLQTQSVDTLGMLASAVGRENFLPLAKETMELGLHLLSQTDEPDLRKSTFGLFANVSSVLQQDMASFLPIVMEAIFTSIRSTSGAMVHNKDENNPNVGLFDNISDEEGEEDLGNTSDLSSDKEESESDFMVENVHLEEKEQAIVTVRELARNCNEVFLPYVDMCFQEVFKLVNSSHDDIKSESLATLAQLCISLHRINTPDTSQALLKALEVVVPKCAEVIRTDKERDVVIAGLDVYCELLREVGPSVLQGEGHIDAIVNCVKDVLNNRTECQDEVGEEDDEGVLAEGDEMMVESAGEIVPLLGKAMNPALFAQHYTQLLPLFCNLSKQQSDAQRSFGVGIIAECMASAGPCLQAYSYQLLSLLKPLTKDSNDEVRNNAIFALGELVYHGKEHVFSHYMEILAILSEAIAVEKNAGVVDNICGALARIIITNASAVPLDQVVPEFLKHIPLREDFEESKWIFLSLNHLYDMRCNALMENLPHVIKSCAVCLHEGQVDEEGKQVIFNLLRRIHADFPAECTRAATELSEPVANILKQVCLS